jgi:purine-nucleoside phosphorylase
MVPSDSAGVRPPAVYANQVKEAAAFIRRTLPSQTRIALILGTGLGRLADDIDEVSVIEYDDIPHFPVSTVESHHGRLIVGSLDDEPVVAMQGRFHLYEGYDAGEVTFPIRVLGELGIEILLISNAAGGMNPIFRRADLMLITDHVNLQGVSPLSGPNNDAWGPRFLDMSEPYDTDLRDLAEKAALSAGIKLQQGVYCAVTGPNLETKAEYRFLRRIGADAVGMSTVPEVIVARHMGMRCMAVSVITDECFPDTLEEVSIADVLAAAAQAEPGLSEIFRSVVRRLK